MNLQSPTARKDADGFYVLDFADYLLLPLHTSYFTHGSRTCRPNEGKSAALFENFQTT